MASKRPHSPDSDQGEERSQPGPSRRFDENSLYYTVEDRYNCSWCFQEFSNEEGFLAHEGRCKIPINVSDRRTKEREMEKVTKFICSLCGIKFIGQKAVENHCITCKNRGDNRIMRISKCKVCKKEFRSNGDYQNHKTTCHDREMKCDMCQKDNFVSYNQYDDHIGYCKGSTGGRKFQTPKEFGYKEGHAANSKTYLLKCNTCDHFFPKISMFERHHCVEVIDGEAFHCLECREIEYSPITFLEHECNQHYLYDAYQDAYMLYFCHHCGSTFEDRVNFKYHYCKKHDFSQTYRKYPKYLKSSNWKDCVIQCDICQNAFSVLFDYLHHKCGEFDYLGGFIITPKYIEFAHNNCNFMYQIKCELCFNKYDNEYEYEKNHRDGSCCKNECEFCKAKREFHPKMTKDEIKKYEEHLKTCKKLSLINAQSFQVHAKHQVNKFLTKVFPPKMKPKSYLCNFCKFKTKDIQIMLRHHCEERDLNLYLFYKKKYFKKAFEIVKAAQHHAEVAVDTRMICLYQNPQDYYISNYEYDYGEGKNPGFPLDCTTRNFKCRSCKQIFSTFNLFVFHGCGIQGNEGKISEQKTIESFSFIFNGNSQKKQETLDVIMCNNCKLFVHYPHFNCPQLQHDKNT